MAGKGSMAPTTPFYIAEFESIGFLETILIAMSEDRGGRGAIDHNSIVLMRLAQPYPGNTVCDTICGVIASLNVNLLFKMLVVVGNDTDGIWWQFSRIKNIPEQTVPIAVFNVIDFDEKGHIIEEYNLKGLTINSKARTKIVKT